MPIVNKKEIHWLFSGKETHFCVFSIGWMLYVGLLCTGKDEMIFLSTKLRLKSGDKTKIEETMNDFNQRRRDKQPLEYPSAGSTFKRPEGYFAGKLIMDSGLAGESFGGAMVSPKHCGFVINTGGATSTDVYELIKRVQNVVYEKFGVRLETEVKLIGEF